MYKIEQDLVDDFLNKLSSSPFVTKGQAFFSTEFNYSRGKTDIVVLDSENVVIAFEAKLKKWRKALNQAYRNTCFANYSYILVPESIVKYTEKYFSEFSKRSVGICFISNGKINISFEAKQNVPLQDYLNERAKRFILESETNARLY